MKSNTDATYSYLVEVLETTSSTAVVEVRATSETEAVQLACQLRHEGRLLDGHFTSEEVDVGGDVVSRSRHKFAWSDVDLVSNPDAPLRRVAVKVLDEEPDRLTGNQCSDDRFRIDRKLVSLALAELDGNAFNLIGAFVKAARQQGWTEAEISELNAIATSGSYDHLLQVLIAHTKEPGE